MSFVSWIGINCDPTLAPFLFNKGMFCISFGIRMKQNKHGEIQQFYKVWFRPAFFLKKRNDHLSWELVSNFQMPEPDKCTGWQEFPSLLPHRAFP